MGGPVGDGRPQSWTTSSLYLFNIIVGTGALSLPSIFSHAGLGLASIFLIFTGFLSFVVSTWLVESMSIISALDQLCADPECVKPDFQVNWMDQCGSMALRILPKWGRVMWFATIIIYMFGDLSVYTVFVPSAFQTVFEADDSVYYIALSVMMAALTPLTFFTFRTTKWMQVVTTITRHTTFWIMIIAAVWRDGHTSERARDVVYFNPSAVPLLYGGVTYSLICQQYIPQVSSVVRDKKNVYTMFYVVFGTCALYYLLMCWTAVYGFSDLLPETCTTHHVCALQPIYTFTFRYLNPSWLGTLVIMFPLLGILTNFPLIAITLRDNMVILLRIILDTQGRMQQPPLVSVCVEAEVGDGTSGICTANVLEAHPVVRHPASSVTTPILDRTHALSVGGRETDAATRRNSVISVSELKEGLLMDAADTVHTVIPLKVRIPLALCACMPPFLIGYVTKNIDLVVRITGSYGGAIIMFVMPVVFAYHARRAARDFSRTSHAINKLGKRGHWMRGNASRSPFQHPGWFLLTLAWAVSAVGINTYSFLAG